MSYCLQGLVHCSTLPCKPAYIPKSRPRGTKALGRTFETRVGHLLWRFYKPLIIHSGTWFQYQDLAKHGVCQVDHFVVLSTHVLLVECKLSETDEAWEQMSRLYAPILEKVWTRPVARVQACRHLRSHRRTIDHPDAALPGKESLWHVLV